MHLDHSEVSALSEAIMRPEISCWMLDIVGPGLKRLMDKKMAGMLQNAAFKFAPENGVPASRTSAGVWRWSR